MRTNLRKIVAGLALTCGCSLIVFAQQPPPPGFNYDESKVPAYTLPEVLRLSDGTQVKDAATWKNKRRPELIALYEQNVYGRVPPPPKGVTYAVRDHPPHALSRLA